MKQYKCINCGAPVKHSYNHHCPYCRSLIDFNVSNNQITKVKPEELVNIDVTIYQNTIDYGLLIYLRGYKCPEPPIVYEANNNIFISKIENYLNPIKCCVCFELSFKDMINIKNYGNSYIRHLLFNMGIRHSEIYRVEQQLVENLNKYI